MATIAPERAQLGYALRRERGRGVLAARDAADDQDRPRRHRRRSTAWSRSSCPRASARPGTSIPRRTSGSTSSRARSLLGRRHPPVPEGRLVRVRPQGRAAHLLRRGRRSEGAGRLRADAVRGIPARGRRAGPRARPAAAARRPPGHGAARPDRQAQRARRAPAGTPGRRGYRRAHAELPAERLAWASVLPHDAARPRARRLRRRGRPPRRRSRRRARRRGCASGRRTSPSST